MQEKATSWTSECFHHQDRFLAATGESWLGGGQGSHSHQLFHDAFDLLVG